MEYYVKEIEVADGFIEYRVDRESLGINTPICLDTDVMQNKVDDTMLEVIKLIDMTKMVSYIEREDDDEEVYETEEDENFTYVVITASCSKGDIAVPILNNLISNPCEFLRCEWIEEYDEDDEILRDGVALIDKMGNEKCFANNLGYNPELDGKEGFEYVDYLHYMAIKNSALPCYARLVEYSWMDFSSYMDLTFKVALPK